MKNKQLSILIGIFVLSSAFCSFISYNAGFGDGQLKTWQELALCTIEDAKQEKCMLPCAEDNDCLAKNGMTDH